MKYLLTFVILILATPAWSEPFVVVNSNTDAVYQNTLLETSDGLDADDTDLELLLVSAKAVAKSNDVYILPVLDMFEYNDAKKCGLTMTVSNGALVIPILTQQELDDTDSAIAKNEELIAEVESYIWDSAIDDVKVGKSQADQDILDGYKTSKSVESKRK